MAVSYEILQEAPNIEYEPELLEDMIAASKAESDAFFKNESEEVSKVMSLLGKERRRAQAVEEKVNELSKELDEIMELI